jgi:hypothetical protein
MQATLAEQPESLPSVCLCLCLQQLSVAVTLARLLVRFTLARLVIRLHLHALLLGLFHSEHVWLNSQVLPSLALRVGGRLPKNGVSTAPPLLRQSTQFDLTSGRSAF